MQNCIVCNHDKLISIYKYNKNLVVSSDAKTYISNFNLLKCYKCGHIQKAIDRTLNNLIDNIYLNYESYKLNCGKEEKIIYDNQEITRSEIIIRSLENIFKFRTGKILDIGTGSGVFLKALSNKYNNWQLYAQDITNKYEIDLYKIKNFKKFYNGIVSNINNKFDIISLIHVLEHINNPIDFLKVTKNQLKKDGIFIVQVPNISINKLDIFIIDHISHFHIDTLYFLLSRFFKYVYIVNTKFEKEITLLASDIKIKEEFLLIKNKIGINVKINNTIKFIEKVKNLSEKVAVFGTSPYAVLCGALLKDNLLFFLDENINKVGKVLLNKKIIHPSNLNKDIKVIFPYSNDLFDIVSKRLDLNFIRYE